MLFPKPTKKKKRRKHRESLLQNKESRICYLCAREGDNNWKPVLEEHHIFGEPQGAAVAEKYDIPAVATLPMDPTFSRLVDEGKVEAYEVEGALDGIIDQIVATCEAE